MQYALIAATLIAACSSVLASPIAEAPGIAGNTQLAIAENQKFRLLNANSTCTANQIACAKRDLAQCVRGKFLTTKCPDSLQCFSLPLVKKNGTSIVCTTDEDAAVRMGAKTVQELEALIGGVTPPNAAFPSGVTPSRQVGTSVTRKKDAKTVERPVGTGIPTKPTRTLTTSNASGTITAGTAVKPRPSGDYQQPSGRAVKARTPQLLEDNAVPGVPAPVVTSTTVAVLYA